MTKLESFEFSLITPQAEILKNIPVTMAVCPVIEGDVGILHSHTPLITTIRAGWLHLFSGDLKIFSMILREEMNGLLHVMPLKTTLTLDQFCPTCFEVEVEGVHHIQSPVSIACPQCGASKIEAVELQQLERFKR